MSSTSGSGRRIRDDQSKPQAPSLWSEVDPWKFSEGGYSRDEFSRYRELCRAIHRDGEDDFSEPDWTLDDGTIMFIESVENDVTWSGRRLESPVEAAARAQAVSNGLGYLRTSRRFKVVVGWTG